MVFADNSFELAETHEEPQIKARLRMGAIRRPCLNPLKSGHVIGYAGCFFPLVGAGCRAGSHGYPPKLPSGNFEGVLVRAFYTLTLQFCKKIIYPRIEKPGMNNSAVLGFPG